MDWIVFSLFHCLSGYTYLIYAHTTVDMVNGLSHVQLQRCTYLNFLIQSNQAVLFTKGYYTYSISKNPRKNFKIHCILLFTLGRVKLIICFWSTLPSKIDQVTRLFIFNFFSKLSLSINFTIVYDFYYASFYAYLIALLFVCIYISSHNVSL